MLEVMRLCNYIFLVFVFVFALSFLISNSCLSFSGHIYRYQIFNKFKTKLFSNINPLLFITYISIFSLSIYTSYITDISTTKIFKKTFYTFT